MVDVYESYPSGKKNQMTVEKSPHDACLSFVSVFGGLYIYIYTAPCFLFWLFKASNTPWSLVPCYSISPEFHTWNVTTDQARLAHNVWSFRKRLLNVRSNQLKASSTKGLQFPFFVIGMRYKLSKQWFVFALHYTINHIISYYIFNAVCIFNLRFICYIYICIDLHIYIYI